MSAGLGYLTNTDSKNFAIKVSDSIDYEVSFWFKQPTREPVFELSAKAFNCDLTQELHLLDVRSGAFYNAILLGSQKICSLENRWNFFHAIIHGKNQPIKNGFQPPNSHAAGTNLIMTEGTAKLFINLICFQNCMLIWDFKVKPASTPFSTGFIQSQGLIEIWRKNNRRDMSIDQIDAITKNFLLPYDASTSVINL